MTEPTFRQLDDLVLDLKGLVLVHDYRERQGADAGELTVYETEIGRARERRASHARDGDLVPIR